VIKGALVARSTVGFVLAGLVTLTAASGCGGVGKLHPVEGKATADGSPLPAGIKINFVSLNRGGPALDIQGTTDASGNYKMTTNGKPGVPAGKFKVVISQLMAAGADLSKGIAEPGSAQGPQSVVDSKFEREDTTPLLVDVPAGPFDLTCTKAAK
jgi:hypothetical protein